MQTTQGRKIASNSYRAAQLRKCHGDENEQNHPSKRICAVDFAHNFEYLFAASVHGWILGCIAKIFLKVRFNVLISKIRIWNCSKSRTLLIRLNFRDMLKHTPYINVIVSISITKLQHCSKVTKRLQNKTFIVNDTQTTLSCPHVNTYAALRA